MKRTPDLSVATMALAAAVTTVPLNAQAPDAYPRIRGAPEVRLDASYLVGMWSDLENCDRVINFRSDGTYVNSDGSSGRWEIAGDIVTLTGSRVVVIRVAPRSRNETIVVQPDGSLGYSRRCLGQRNPAQER